MRYPEYSETYGRSRGCGSPVAKSLTSVLTHSPYGHPEDLEAYLPFVQDRATDDSNDGRMKHGDHHYFVMHTEDLLASEKFFAKLLGWEFEDGQLSNVEFFGALSDSSPRAIWVHVEDCEAAVARIAELGGDTGELTEDRSGLNAVCQDDQGNTFRVGTLVEDYRNYPHPDPLPTGELGYFKLPVGDTDRAVEFHGQLFGWTFDPAGSTGIQPDYRHCNNGALPFGFTSGGHISPDYYFRVNDVEAGRSAVAELGGSHGQIVDSGTGSTLTACEAPGGVRFNLWQPADGS